MHSARLIFMAERHLNTDILKSNLRTLWYFYISQNFFWMKTDSQKSTKLHVQPGNHCFLKVDEPIYIHQIGCIALG